MTTLENTVRSVIEDFMLNEVLFTALDVSNTVKQSLPHARHREVRDVVRSLFTSDMEPKSWARTPISVSLDDGTNTEALLYHPLSDSWDLDNKYNTQMRAATSLRPAAAISLPTQSAPQPAATTVAPVVPSQSAPLPATPMPTARSVWDQMFKTQPSLFPRK